MIHRNARALLPIVALLFACPWAYADQSQRPLPGKYTLDDAPVPSVCVEEGVSLRLEPTVYTSVGKSLKVRRVHDGKPEEMSLQDAIDRGLLVCRSRDNGHLGLVFEVKQPGDYVLTVPTDAPAVVARSEAVRARIEPLVTQALPRVPDGLAGKELEAFADEIHRGALARRGPQQDQWTQLRKAGLEALRDAAGEAFTIRQTGDRVRFDGGALVVPERAVFRDLLGAIQIVQWLKVDADLAAAAAKWPRLDEQLVGDLRRLKRHAVATAIVKDDDPETVWLHRDGLADVRLSTVPADERDAALREWVALLNEGDLVVDMTGLPKGTDPEIARRARSAAATLRQLVPGAKVLLARGPNWKETVHRMWSSGPSPVGVVVKPDAMGKGLGAIHAEIVKMFAGFPKLDDAARFGAVVTPPEDAQTLKTYANEVRKSQTLNGVPVAGRQWLLVACRDNSGDAATQHLDDLAAALESAGAAQVITHAAPLNGLAASVAISEFFARLEAAAANPLDLWPEWPRAQRDARAGLAEIQLPPELPASATDLLKHALEQLSDPDATSGPSVDARRLTVAPDAES